ncbi:hypothetical protein, partial [Salmonella sp. SAL04269]|uniref:hypothetical protein n=1 Tax=Salmonella sp. SAL04269 TaxID=3159847 RepID=UPI00397A4791
MPNAIDLAGVADVVGATSYERGVRYARQGRVERISWDNGTNTLFGEVIGQSDVYQTTAHFVHDRNGV